MTLRRSLLITAVLASDSAAAQAAPKVLTVADDMDSRRIFKNPEEAVAYLTHCGETFSDFGSIPLAAPGVDEEGNFDPAIYNDSMHVMVATLRNVGKGVKAIVVAPIPTLDAVLADPAAREWLTDRVLNKELNHVAVRALRTAEDISVVVDQMPTTLAAYYSTARESSGIMETFNALYKQLNEIMSKKVPSWAKARLVKSDLKRALESKGYAEEYYPALENRGEGKDSLFVVALQLAVQAAKLKGLDPTIFERWKETRDAKKFTGAPEEEAEDFDIDSLSAALVAAPAEGEKKAEPEAEPAPAE